MKFWKDNWCGDVALCTSFLIVYPIANFKEDFFFFFDQRGLGGVCLAPKSRRGMLGPLFF